LANDLLTRLLLIFIDFNTVEKLELNFHDFFILV